MKKKSMLAALVMLSLLQGSVYAEETVEITTQEQFDQLLNDGYLIYQGDNNKITIGVAAEEGTAINGERATVTAGNGNGNTLVVNYAVIKDLIASSATNKNMEGNTVIVNSVNGNAVDKIYGAEILAESLTDATQNFAEENTVSVQESQLSGVDISAVYADGVGEAINNTLEIKNTTLVNDSSSDHVRVAFVNYGTAANNNLTIVDSAASGNINAAYVGLGSAINNHVTVTNLKYAGDGREIKLVGGESKGNFLNNTLTGPSDIPAYVSGNSIDIYGENEIAEIYGGIGSDAFGNNLLTVSNNSINIYGKVQSELIIAGFSENSDVDLKDNIITLHKDSEVKGDIVAGLSGGENAEISGNEIRLWETANVEDANLYGYEKATSNTYDNNLVIDKGWTGTANCVQNFNNIKFNNLVWNTNPDEAVLTTNGGSLDGTNVSFTLQSGQKVNVGESMTLISSSTDLGTIANNGQSLNTTMGVAADVSATLEQTGNKVMATVDNIELNDQTMLVAESRAVASAFINQGTDLIADSLDTLSRDGKYGVKTFAAVHGNRSKYDVNSDIKINGWSTIVGVGSETEHNGGDFSWGVFYENGSGNYRTFNSFNNEYFRGDGSLVYNGGGIAARYENAHGVYTEGSLRAGMLKSDMDNALSDGENKYGYSSESEYYGAHIGIGQIIPLSESSDLDVYGKFFHTYTEGDSFKVDTDEFEFDSINSDRLRVGARLTTNKENKFSTYYGLAYEYEFNGDAEMRAAGMSAPTQSLQGSSYMAEVGFNYQPTPESPWSFDLNMRGYAGEREGATFNVQATYTF